MELNGLTKYIKFENGSIVRHWKVDDHTYHKDIKQLQFFMLGYVSKTVHDDGKPHIVRESFQMNKEDAPFDYIDLNRANRNIIMRMYDFAKSDGQLLEGAVNIVE